ncbi:MAG: YbaK/EbsC family protein [Phycisphaerae bacterium]|nr:YbaK/EbsC family protein [Phycisphaerae bacterium]
MDIQTFLNGNKVPYVRLLHGSVYTAQELAAREHVPGSKVAKPVLVKAGDDFILCVVPASHRVDLERVAQLAGQRYAALATETEMKNIFKDCEIGAEPPFGEPYGVQTWMDDSIQADDYLVFQSGRHTEAIKIARTDYERLARPRVAHFARHV